MLDAAKKAVTEASRVPGREEEVRERRESEGEGKTTRGRGDWSATGVTSTAPGRPEGQPAQPASFSPAASSRRSRGGGRKGFPVQEAAQAAAASSLTLLSPAPPISHSPRRRVPAPPAADPHTASARPLSQAPRPRPLPAPPGTPNSFTRRRPRPARARRVGTGAGAQEGWSVPHLSPAPGSRRASGPRRRLQSPHRARSPTEMAGAGSTGRAAAAAAATAAAVPPLPRPPPREIEL